MGSEKAKGRKKRKSDLIIDCRSPRDPSRVKELADLHRKGEDFDPNDGVMSLGEYMELINKERAHRDDPDNNPPVHIYPIYQPFIMEYATRIGAKVAINGTKASGPKKPDGWDEDKLGKWEAGMAIRDARKSHIKKITDHVIDLENNLVQIELDGKMCEFVLGVFNIAPTTRGNKFHNWISGMKIAHEDTPDLDYLVGRIVNDTVKVNDLVFGYEGQVIQWGFIFDGDEILSHDEIRAAIGNENFDWSGVEFDPLSKEEALDKFAGKAVTKPLLVEEVKKSMTKPSYSDENGQTAWDILANRKPRVTKDEDKEKEAQPPEKRLWDNMGTMARQELSSVYCFGLPNIQIGIALVPQHDESGQNRVYRFFIGQYSVSDLKESAWQARKRVAKEQEPKGEIEVEAEEEHEEVPEPTESEETVAETSNVKEMSDEIPDEIPDDEGLNEEESAVSDDKE